MPAGFPSIRHDPTKPDAHATLRAQPQQSQASTSSSSSERKSKYQFPIGKDDIRSKSLSKEVDSQSVNTQSSRTGLLSKMTKR